MKLFLVPPHADFSLEWSTPPGFDGLNLSRALAVRMMDRAGLEARAREATAQGDLTRVLRLSAAQAILGRPSSLFSRLRALGASLTAAVPSNAQVQLRLDDLELRGGTTERSADVLSAANDLPALGPELAQALEATREASVVRLHLSQDQQLPAACAIAAALAPGVVLELDGPFALRHATALLGVGPFGKARIVGKSDAVATPRVRSLGALQLTRGDGEPCARIAPFSLLDGGDDLSASTTLIVPFCALGPDAQDAVGDRMPRERLHGRLRALEAQGVRTVGEWFVGGPAVTLPQMEETLSELLSDFPCPSFSGLRPFHWTVEREGTRFGSAHVRLLEQNPTLTLARGKPFEAEGTLPHAVLAERTPVWVKALSKRWELFPGRIAAAYVSPPVRSSAGLAPRQLALDPDCAVVELHGTLDGRPGPAFYAVNLRTSDVLAIDARLAPEIAKLVEPREPSLVLATVPADKRTKLVEALVQKGVLTRGPDREMPS